MAKDWDKVTIGVERTGTEVDKTGKKIETNRKHVKGMGSDFAQLNQGLSLFGKVISVAKIPAFTAAIGYAVKVVSALTGGAISLVGALGPLGGLLVAYPALFGAAAQAMIAFKVAGVEKLSEALKGNKKALESLTPEAMQLVKQIKSLKPEWEKLQKAVQKPLFEDAYSAIQSANKNFGVFEKVMEGTGVALGHVIEKAGELAGSKGFGGRFQKIGEQNNVTIERLGSSGLKFADALTYVLHAAEPFINWLTKGVETFAKWTDQQAKAGDQSGQMGKFFEKTKEVMTTLWHTVDNLGTALYNIAKIGTPLGNEMLSAFEGASASFKEWTESAKGKNSIVTYFKEIKTPLWEMGRLLHDVTTDLFGLGKSEGLTPFLKALRTEVLPVLDEFIANTTKSFGPTLTHALVELIKLASIFAGTSGPLEVTAKIITKIAEAINWIAREIPYAKEVMVTLVGAAAIFKGVKFVGMITGLTNVITLLEKAAVKMGLLDAALTETNGGPGVLGGVASKLGLGKKATTVAEQTAAGAGEQTIAGVAVKDIEKGGETTAIGGISGLAARYGVGSLVQGAAKVAIPATIVLTGVEVSKHISAKNRQLAHNVASGGSGYSLPSLPIVGHPEGTEDILDAVGGLFGGGSKSKSFSEKGGHPKSLVPKGVLGAAVLKKEWKDTMKDMIQSSIYGMSGINAAFKQGLAEVNSKGAKGFQLHEQVARQMKAAVKAIESGMKAGTVPVKQGKEEINKLLHEIHVTEGKDPFHLAEVTVKNFKEAGSMAGKGAKEWIEELKSMPKGARMKAMESINGMTKAWAEGHPKLEAQFKLLTQSELSHFGRTNTQLEHGAAKTMANLAGQVEGGAKVTGAALGNIMTNLGNALTSLGEAKIPTFTITQLSAASQYHHAREAAEPGFAGGGVIPGYGLHDHVLINAAPDEAVVNRHQQAHINNALGFASSMGAGQYGSLNQLFAGEQRPHNMASGGIVKQQISGGPKADRNGLNNGVDKVWKAAVAYYDRHNGKGKLIANGSRMDAEHQPYLWGGGHGATASKFGPWDCSGGTSELFNGSGLKGSNFNFAPMISTGFEQWGKGGRGDVTVLANSDHVYSVIKGKGAIGTSDYNPGGGYGWVPNYTFRPGFTERHVNFDELGATSRTGGPRGGSSNKGQKQVKGLAGGGYVGDINHTFAKHWSPDFSGETLPGFVIASLAQAAGNYFGYHVPGETMEQITLGESGRRPGAGGTDPGGTEGWGLWAITSPFQNDKVSKYGGYSQMLNPVKNAAVMAETYHERQTAPWYGTSHVTDWNKDYTGNYDISNALGGVSFGQAIGHPKAGESTKAGKTKPIPKTLKGAYNVTSFNSALGVFGAERHYKVTTEKLTFEAIPSGTEQIRKELRERQRQAAEYRAAIDDAKKRKRVTSALEANLLLLKQRIERLRVALQAAVHKEMVSKAVGNIAKKSEFTGIDKNLENLHTEYEELMENAEQVVNTEPREPAGGATADWIKNTLEPYIFGTDPGSESGAFGLVLGKEAQWRNALIGAENVGVSKMTNWKQQIDGDTDQIKVIKGRISELKKTGTAKQKKAIPGLTARYEGLEAERNQYRANITKTRTETMPAWASELAEVQGIGRSHEIVPHLPSSPTAGQYGGLIWSTQESIAGLGLNIPEAGTTTQTGPTELEEQGKEFGAQIAAEELKRAAVNNALAPVFSEFFGHVPKYGGTFHTGGVVPGARNEERTIIAKAGEIVARPENMTSPSDHWGDLPQPTMIIEDDAIDRNKIKHVYKEQQRSDLSAARRRVNGG